MLARLHWGGGPVPAEHVWLHAHLQIVGFNTGDPSTVKGTTSLGPSLDVTRELREKGRTAYSFRNFVDQDVISGTLTRSAAARVSFPVLVNGVRRELDAIHATGQMGLHDVTRPFETYVLDHAKLPVSLRIAYGPRGGSVPFEPDFARARSLGPVDEVGDGRTVLLDELEAEGQISAVDLHDRAVDAKRRCTLACAGGENGQRK